ncbi:MAG: amidophosphoribosyltransferase [Oscillospiraceae bacterium]|jgi:amidophosphoribosyltransferase|nr:amidophosphoribosyltransferase [Oscillospiraceae bacterium]
MIHEECGVFGVYCRDDLPLAQEIYTALFALQHRGQLSCGITINLGGGEFVSEKGMGLVPDVFNRTRLEALMRRGHGIAGIGHVRYSPARTAEPENTQPLVMRYARGAVAVANNGGLTNADELRRALTTQGSVFQTGTDAELIGSLTARARLHTDNIEDALVDAMHSLRGAYSAILLSPEKLIAVRDPQGFRPLCIGRLGKAWLVASESCAIRSIGGTFVRDVEPGEVVVLGQLGLTNNRTHCDQKHAHCLFEYTYFARADSALDGVGVHNLRVDAGARLARECPVEADCVVGVPDNGIDAAIGYARESGIRYETGFIKNRYVGRAFFQGTQAERKIAVAIKHNPIRAAVAGKRVVLVDDSIVRGMTAERIVGLLRSAGALEVHYRVTTPPFHHVCPYGTDISDPATLLSNKVPADGIAAHLGADSVGFLSLDGLLDCIGDRAQCTACYTGAYPVEPPTIIAQDIYARPVGV